MAKAKKSTTKSRAKSRFKTLKKSGEVKDVKGLIAEGGFEGVKGTGRKGKVKRRDVKAALLSDEQGQYFERRDKEQVARDQEAAVKKAASGKTKVSTIKATKPTPTTSSKSTSGTKTKEEGEKISANNERIQANMKAKAAVKPGETYTYTAKDGSTKEVRKPKPTAAYGAKVKAIKK